MDTGNVTVDYIVKIQKKKKELKGTIRKRKLSLLKKMQGDSGGTANDYVGGLFVHHAILTNIKKIKWIVNSGTTGHMCHYLKNLLILGN